jgi:hypothetical protein
MTMADIRLIDANALIKDLELLAKYQGECKQSTILGVCDTIKWRKTIDAVPVVRCRDCEKFWEYTEEHKETVEKADGDCMIRCMVAPDDPQFCAVQKDDYCSMSKRKGAKMDGKEG